MRLESVRVAVTLRRSTHGRCSTATQYRSGMLYKELTLLLVEDSLLDAELIVDQLERANFVVDCQRVQTESEYLSWLAESPDLILADSSLPQFDGLRALELLTQRNLNIPFILISGRIDKQFAIDVMRRGAYGYVLKNE